MHTRFLIIGALLCSHVAHATCGGFFARLEIVRRLATIATGRATRDLPTETYAIFHRAHEARKAGGEFVPSAEDRARLGPWNSLFDQYNSASNLVGLFRRIDRAAALWRRSDLRLRTTTVRGTTAELAPMVDVLTNLRRVRALRIYEKVMNDPTASLTAKENERLATWYLTEDLERFRHSVATGETAPTQHLNQSWARENRSAIRRAAIEGARLPFDLGLRLARLALPIPGRAFATMKKRRLIGRLLQDPTYDLDAHRTGLRDYFALFSDRAFAEKFHLREPERDEIERFRRDLELHGKAFARLNMLRWAGEGVRWTTILGAIALGLFPQHFMTTQESFDEGLEEDDEGNARSDEPGYRGMSRNQRRRVTLIFTSPLPHASIRVGGLVYNYGQGDVTVMRLEEYRQMVGFGELTSGNHTRVELELTPEQIDGLREVLERDVERGKYTLVFPFNDCVAMVNHALRDGAGIDVPPVADRSQALTIGYFRGAQMMGSRMVGPISFATRDDQTALHRTADSAVNAADALYFTQNAKHLLLFSKIYDSVFGTHPE